MADHGSKRWRLVLTASPLQGHMTPMLQLGTYLHSKGFSITIAHTEFNRPDPSKHPDFIFHPLPDKLSGPGISAGFIPFMQTLNDNCKPHFKEHLSQIINAQKDRSDHKESIVIIHDNLMFFAAAVARELDLPSIILRSSSAAFTLAMMIIPQLHQEGRFPTQDSLLQEIVPELDPFRYKDLPFIGRPIEETLQSITMIISKTPSAMVWNTIEFLEQSTLTHIRDHFQVPIFTVGPLHKIIPTPSTSFLEEDMSCISWLDKQAPKSVIYVSIGSLENANEKVAIEMAWGLVNSNQLFLWVVRPGSVPRFKWTEFLPDGLVAQMKDRGLIVKWAPQKEVLAHKAVGGFWSHCGWNSTLESISEGVPMLCQPFDVDQKLNARYLSHVWKIGVEIVVKSAEIESAIRQVLVGKEAVEMRQRAMEIQDKIKFALCDSGSSNNTLNDLVGFILSHNSHVVTLPSTHKGLVGQCFFRHLRLRNVLGEHRLSAQSDRFWSVKKVKNSGNAMQIHEKVKVAMAHGGSSHNSYNDLVQFIFSL